MGDTITWVVATLVIVAVLSISVFVTKGISGNKPIFLDDKEKDFLATKSITSFLRNQDNIDLLNGNKYGELKIKTEKLTEIMVGVSLQSAWDFELSDKDKIKVDVIHSYPAPGDSPIIDAFETNIFLKQDKLKYWKKCKDVCK